MSFHRVASDFESKEFDLGTTSVRVVRVGNVIQEVFSSKLEARVFYAEITSRLKREEDKLGLGKA